MRMNRRNVLVGLGTIVAGGGTALATGAFSSVEASRNVTIETNDDADAYLSLSAADGAESYITTETVDGTEVLAVVIDQLNENATTTIDELVSIDVNSEEFEIDSVEATVENGGDILSIANADGLASPPYTFGLEIDLENSDASDISADAAISIVADATPVTE